MGRMTLQEKQERAAASAKLREEDRLYGQWEKDVHPERLQRRRFAAAHEKFEVWLEERKA